MSEKNPLKSAEKFPKLIRQLQIEFSGTTVDILIKKSHFHKVSGLEGHFLLL